jgi:hypothetical protein
MATLTATEARVNLSSVLRQALAGNDIGIVMSGKVRALRPVEVISRDYAEREYGIKPAQMKTIAQKLSMKTTANRRLGKSKTFTGNLNAVLGN